MSVSDWLRNGTESTTTSLRVAASVFSSPSKVPSDAWAAARSAAWAARAASREPMTTGTPARPQRTARPNPSAPVAPMIDTGDVKGGRV